ncbi:MAG: MFS transporter [Pseudomonadota bacterium]
MAIESRTVQAWIDESPRWQDGTTVASTPMTPMQLRIWALAAAGKFFEGMVVFMTGVALPLIAIEFGLGPFEHGLVTAASLFGILVGASLLGGLADSLGRRTMFIAEMIIFTAFLVAVCFSTSFWFLLVCLLGLGIALGCDYPTAHVMISETMSSRVRGRLVLGAFAFQAVGALFGTVVGYLILANLPEIDAWRWMYAAGVVPAVVVVVLRFTVVETPHWLHHRNRVEDAERSILQLLRRTPPYPKHVSLAKPRHRADQATSRRGYGALFSKKHRKATILASVPWFLQDLGTYGIGIFTPLILVSTLGQGKEHATSVADVVQNDMLAAQGAAMIDVLLIVGIAFAILLADRVGRMPLQIVGFVGCAVGLAIAALSASFDGVTQTLMIFAGFMLFNFMTNMGPNAQTYLIAGEVFPTEIRAKGAGFAASFAKVGAVITAFLFPILLLWIGTGALLWILVGTSLFGAILTWWVRIETAGKNLEDLHR